MFEFQELGFEISEIALRLFDLGAVLGVFQTDEDFSFFDGVALVHTDPRHLATDLGSYLYFVVRDDVPSGIENLRVVLSAGALRRHHADHFDERRRIMKFVDSD